MLNREVTSAKGGGIWAADIWGSYRVQRLDWRGVLQLEIVRHADWFPEGQGPSDLAPDLPPFPSVAAVVEDTTGLVWVFVRVADKRWSTALTVRKPALIERVLEAVPATHDVTDVDAAYDTIVEVFDPIRRVLVAATRVDKLFRFSVAPGRVGHLQLASDGSLIPEILDGAVSPLKRAIYSIYP